MGSDWLSISKEFPGCDRTSIKNRFYSTLRRVARKHKSTKKNGTSLKLMSYLDIAIDEGHNCYSKRGRKRKNCEVRKVNNKELCENFPQLKGSKRGRFLTEEEQKSFQKTIEKNSNLLTNFDDEVDSAKRHSRSEKYKKLMDLYNSINEMIKETMAGIETLMSN